MATNGVQIARARILTLSPITDIVPEQSIFPLELPQGAPAPCLLIGIISTNRTLALGGHGKQYTQRITIEASSLEQQQVIDIGDLMLELLPCVKETIGGGSLVDIVHADIDQTDTSDDLLTFRRFQHYRVHWWN